MKTRTLRPFGPVEPLSSAARHRDGRLRFALVAEMQPSTDFYAICASGTAFKNGRCIQKKESLGWMIELAGEVSERCARGGCSGTPQAKLSPQVFTPPGLDSLTPSCNPILSVSPRGVC
jgi:hypothetical protein